MFNDDWDVDFDDDVDSDFGSEFVIGGSVHAATPVRGHEIRYF